MFKLKKHYTPEEVLAKFDKKSDKLKIKILKSALKRASEEGGSYDYNIAVTMGYYYSDDYNEPTYVYGGK